MATWAVSRDGPLAWPLPVDICLSTFGILTLVAQALFQRYSRAGAEKKPAKKVYHRISSFECTVGIKLRRALCSFRRRGRELARVWRSSKTTAREAKLDDCQ